MGARYEGRTKGLEFTLGFEGVASGGGAAGSVASAAAGAAGGSSSDIGGGRCRCGSKRPPRAEGFIVDKRLKMEDE